MISTYQKAFADMLGIPHVCAFWKGRAAFYTIYKRSVLHKETKLSSLVLHVW